MKSTTTQFLRYLFLMVSKFNSAICFLSNALICDQLGQLIVRLRQMRHFIQSENVNDRFHNYCQ